MREVNILNFQLNRKTIISNIATVFTGTAIAQLLNSVTFILMARQVGPEQIGQYASTMVLATFSSIVFSLGLNIWLLREGGKEPALIGKLTGSILIIKISIGFVWLMILFLFASLINSETMPANLIRLAAVLVLFDNLFKTALAGFRSILRNNINSILQVISALMIFLITILLVKRGDDQVEVFMYSRFIVLLTSFVISIFFARLYLRLKLSYSTSITAISESLPFAASEFLALSYRQMDVLIIAFLLNDYAVGLYSPAVGIINSLFLVPLAINFVMLPVLSNLFKHNIQQAWITSRRFLFTLIVVGAALSVSLYLGTNFLVFLLGSAFSGSRQIIQVLSIILFFHSVAFGTVAILISTGQQTKRSIVQAIAVTINVILNFFAIQLIGILGAAYVYVLTEFLLLLGYTYLVLRYRSQNFPKYKIDSKSIV